MVWGAAGKEGPYLILGLNTLMQPALPLAGCPPVAGAQWGLVSGLELPAS